MSESISWDGQDLRVRVDERLPFRACGHDIEMSAEGMKDEHGHAIGYVHLREHVAAFAALQIIHTLHYPDPEDFAPRCPVCSTPAPCQTRRATTAALYEVKP